MVIRCAEGLNLSAAGLALMIQVGDTWITPMDYSLPVIDAFRVPMTFSDGVKRLQATARTPDEWMAMTREIHRLLQLGVLVSDDAPDLAPARETLPTAKEVKLHVDLLRDSVRTQVYLAALKEIVRPGDVVVDIGTGNGVLAMGAARAGARHVYAIEANPMGQTTRRIFEANGFADRITLIQGWSVTVNLPEKADLIVSEILSNDVFTENALQSTRDAERRLLKPGGRVIPTEARIFGRLITVPDRLRSQRTVAPGDVADWGRRYGLDFSALHDAQWHGQMQTWVSPPEVLDGGVLLSEAVEIGAVQLTHITSLAYAATAEIVCVRAGRLDGVLGHFDLDVIPGHRMTTDPLAEARANSWRNPLWFCEPMQVSAGDRLRLTLIHEHRHPLSVELKIERL
ncbi:MAG: 50S ribosomal protein L11 methyltransferase [Anaerolineae bacterium]|nr:50S ribosomal protein L11 methyltransferase [Anaerolineae bacterium]